MASDSKQYLGTFIANDGNFRQMLIDYNRFCKLLTHNQSEYAKETVKQGAIKAGTGIGTSNQPVTPMIATHMTRIPNL